MSKSKCSILITGAGGFVGKALVQALHNEYKVIAATRKPLSYDVGEVEQVIIEDLAVTQDWSKALSGVDIVIHTAARVHQMNDTAKNPLEAYRRTNTQATIELAKQAAKAGVQRFIFLSTAKVHGELTDGRAPYTEEDDCFPTDPYAISKWEAEKGLLKVANDTGMGVITVRPPLIYGPGVKGNFSRLVNLVKKRIPLPLGCVTNKRSILAIDNLVSFISVCLAHPMALNQVFLLSDIEDQSIKQLLNEVAIVYDRKTMLIPVPLGVLSFVSFIFNKVPEFERLHSSFLIDSRKAKSFLNWEPVVTMRQQLITMKKEEPSHQS